MIQKICKSLKFSLLIISIIIIAVLAIPKTVNYKVFDVSGNSMDPGIPAGSLVYVSPTAPEKIQAGDIISFYFAKEKNSVATHRVTTVDSKSRRFTTKGDNNESVDFIPVSFDRYIGKEVFHIPFLGYILAAFKTAAGVWIVLSVIAAIMFLSIFTKLKNKKMQITNPCQMKKT